MPTESETTARRTRAAPMAPTERRKAIIDAVIPLVRQYGYDVSTRRLAEAAGVAEGTLFRVFEDKRSLLDEAVHAALDPTDLREQLRHVDLAQPLRPRVEEAAGILQEWITGVVELMTAIRMAGVDGPHPPHQEKDASDNDPGQSALVAVFEPDRDALRIEPDAAARYLRMLSLVGAHPGINDGHPIGPEEITALLFDGVLRRDREPRTS